MVWVGCADLSAGQDLAAILKNSQAMQLVRLMGKDKAVAQIIAEKHPQMAKTLLNAVIQANQPAWYRSRPALSPHRLGVCPYFSDQTADHLKSLICRFDLQIGLPICRSAYPCPRAAECQLGAHLSLCQTGRK